MQLTPGPTFSPEREATRGQMRTFRLDSFHRLAKILSVPGSGAAKFGTTNQDQNREHRTFVARLSVQNLSPHAQTF